MPPLIDLSSIQKLHGPRKTRDWEVSPELCPPPLPSIARLHSRQPRVPCGPAFYHLIPAMGRSPGRALGPLQPMVAVIRLHTSPSTANWSACSLKMDRAMLVPRHTTLTRQPSRGAKMLFPGRHPSREMKTCHSPAVSVIQDSGANPNSSRLQSCDVLGFSLLTFRSAENTTIGGTQSRILAQRPSVPAMKQDLGRPTISRDT